VPELPEVETIVITLRPKLAGAVITGAEIFFPKVIEYPTPEEFNCVIKSKEIIDIKRRGKYLLWELSGGLVLVLHLRMTGRLIYSPSAGPPTKHTRLILNFAGGSQLRFEDPRKFGRTWLLPQGSLKELATIWALGPEPLGNSFSAGYLAEALKNRSTMIKTLLLDQKIVAGLGNIYADEALHLAGIAPWRPAKSLDLGEVSHLVCAIREVLKEGIAHRGTTIRDYADSNGSSGNHQNFLRVYGREGQACTTCGSIIARKKIGGRSSYFCPTCQQG